MRRIACLVLCLAAIMGCDGPMSPEEGPGTGTAKVILDGRRPATDPAQLLRMYDELCRSYASSAWPPYKLSRFTWAIRWSEPTLLEDDGCQTQGPGETLDAGTYGAIRCLVHKSPCGRLFFEFRDWSNAYALGPGGWAAWHRLP